MRLLEVKQPNIIVVYGGGFQPFHEGHASSYREAKAAFPGAYFFVAASNVTTERPFEFKEKQFLAKQAGVVDPFIQVGTMSYVNDNGRKVTSTPLNPLEVLQKFNPEKDILVIVRSERDPMKTTDVSYYQPWQGQQGAEPFSKHAYIFVTKKHDFTIAGNPVYSGSQVRELYSGADDKTKLSILQDLYPQSRQLAKIKQIFDKRLAVAEGVAEGKYTPASQTEEDILIKGKKVGKITKITTKNGRVFYSAEVGNSYITGADTRQQALRDLKRLISWKNEEDVAEGSLNEFAVDGFGDSGDKRSKLLASVGRLLDGGNKVDWQVPGQMGHVTRVQDDGITMKRWKMPRSKMSFFLPMSDDSRDSKYTIKMVAPKHYAVVSAEQDVDEGWFKNTAASLALGAAAMGGAQANTTVDDPSWHSGKYPSHVKSDHTIQKQTGSSSVHQKRISDVTGPNAAGEYKVTVTQNGKIASQYVTKTPPPDWMMKEQDLDEASLATMRDYFAGDENARDPYEITKQRLHFAKDKNVVANKRKEFRSQWEYEQWLKKHNLKQISDSEEYDLEEEAANLLEYLRKIHKRWAIVSKKGGRPLVYFKGDGKPSKDWVEKQERRINYFKHKK